MRKGRYSKLPRITFCGRVISRMRGDYYDGKAHDDIRFKDGEGNMYLYSCPMSAEGDNLSQFGRALEEYTFGTDDKIWTISARAYQYEDKCFQIYAPRLIKDSVLNTKED